METTDSMKTDTPPSPFKRLSERERALLERAGAELAPGAYAVLAAVAEDAADRLPGLIAALSEKERRSCARFLKAWSECARPWTPRRKALLVAGAGCHTGAADVARWITGRSMADVFDTDSGVRVLRLLAGRPGDWLADVAHRVLARSGRRPEHHHFSLVRYLLLLSGAPTPDDERFVRGWMSERWDWDADRWPLVVDGSLADRPQDGGRPPLVEQLRADPGLDEILPRVFETDGTGHLLEAGDPLATDSGRDVWYDALTALCREGRLDREALLDGALARLLRPGRPGDLRGFRKLLDALEPTEDEYAARTATLLRLLPDTPSPVAGHAQKVLARLDEAGRLEDEHLVDASASVLFRTEATLVRAQLSWLDRAARRDRSRAGLAALAAADAFGHGDLAVQERALNLVARHLPAAGDAVRPGLVAAAAALTPALRGRAAEVLGGAVADDRPEPDVLPAVSGPRPMEAPPATAVEVAEEVNAITSAMRRRDWGGASDVSSDVPAFERILDGLVRHAHRDRDGLVHALQAVARTHPWTGLHPYYAGWDTGDVRCVVAEILGETTGSPLWETEYWVTKPSGNRRSNTSPLNAVLRERLREVARMVVGGAPPFLLATPTLTDGRIDPAALVERIAEYERVGAVPGEVDLSQALLRVDAAACGGDVLARARGLASDAGRRLTAWLEAGGLPEPEPERLGDVCRCGKREAEHLLFACERVDAPTPLAEVFGPVLEAGSEPPPVFSDDIGHWPSVVPVRRELVALHLQPTFAEAVYEAPGSRMLLLPALAEGSGAAGPALHLGLACGLGARNTGIRTAAVDALLALAARGGLDPALLGRELAEATRYGHVGSEPLAESVREAARSGASGAVWTALSAALPALLDRDTEKALRSTKGLYGEERAEAMEARNLAHLLEAATEIAHHHAFRGAVPQVSALAAHKGSTRLLKAARHLRDALSD
ncbi:DUF6493 family protein [Actinorugispora endophytica]|uniref:HEAT repeat protein n=1 Tax=Actinorugispora endophytica TaxID=1605990 RepID=A0A4R6UZH0_9ACTN|nr:DUF6493 family protein [Actinorugispora endophytica]TDQ52986.1 hypothetical protein EV190_105103 [Actinorugispora endophytica]